VPFGTVTYLPSSFLGRPTGTVGTVKFFDRAAGKGYGFISRVEGPPDVLVHFKDISGAGFRALTKGDTVEYDCVEGPKGLRATNVKLVKAADEIQPTSPPKAVTKVYRECFLYQVADSAAFDKAMSKMPPYVLGLLGDFEVVVCGVWRHEKTAVQLIESPIPFHEFTVRAKEHKLWPMYDKWNAEIRRLLEVEPRRLFSCEEHVSLFAAPPSDPGPAQQEGSAQA
jgi:CspA family cold shock protein